METNGVNMENRPAGLTVPLDNVLSDDALFAAWAHEGLADELGPATIREARKYIETLATILELRGPPTERVEHCGKHARRPTHEPDPYSAFVDRCELSPPSGQECGPRLGVKEVIPVGGMPCSVAPFSDEAIVPKRHAVAVARLLEAGSVMIGTTSSRGYYQWETRNPHNPRYSPGFSSSGSGAAVATGVIDIGLGTDYGGSVRIPAAWCGTVGMKATQGVVPSSRLLGRRPSEIGPITRTVQENAFALRTIVGDCWQDPAWDSPEVSAYGANFARQPSAYRLGIVGESLDNCSPGTLSAFENHIGRLARGGVRVDQLSVPLWSLAPLLFYVRQILSDAIRARSFWESELQNYKARIDIAVLEPLLTVTERPEGRANSLVASFLDDTNSYIPIRIKSLELERELCRQIDAALAGVDVLITPTTKNGPFKLLPKPISGAYDFFKFCEQFTLNTCQLNLTGHPALSVPSDPGDEGLPTGVQVIGRRFREGSVYLAGLLVEEFGEQWTVDARSVR